MRALVLAVLLGAGVASAEELPRLTGTVVAPGHRAALFVAGSGVVTPVEEGESVGGYVVRAIGPGGVQLERDGKRVLLAPGRAEAVAAPPTPSGVTFGLALRPQPPVDD